jgi:hypothetical protein
MLRLALFNIRDRGIEPDFDGILAGLEKRLHLEFVGAKHVVSSGNFAGIDFYTGKGIQSFASEKNLLVQEEIILDFKGSPVNPVHFTYPLETVLIVTVVWVGDFSGCQ